MNNVHPKVYRAIVGVAQVELQLLERQAAARYVIQYVATVLMYPYTAVVLIHRDLSEYVARAGRA